MPKLKDYFSSDLDTFINSNEFAIEVDIEGKPTEVVMDSETLKEMQLKSGGEGLASSELLFHVRKSNLDFEPFPGQDLLFEGSLYYIDDVKEDEGLYTITLGVARS